MIKVRKANVVLTIEDDEKNKYMRLGYSVINKEGKVIEQALPTDMAELQHFYIVAHNKIASLEEEIKQLKSELAKVKKTKATKE